MWMESCAICVPRWRPPKHEPTTNGHEWTQMVRSSYSKKKFFKSLAVPLRFSTHSAMAWLRSHMKMRWWWSLACEKFLFGSSPRSTCSYKGHRVGLFIPDLIAFDALIVDTKMIDRITDHERGLMLNYLRITRLRVGVILNFIHRKLEWERIVL